MELFWELQQQAEIAGVRREASNAAQRVEWAERKAEKALMICEALWILLRDKLGMKDEELLARVKAIDLSDGQLDGRVRRPPLECKQCKRETSQRFARCMYCGSDLPASPFGA